MDLATMERMMTEAGIEREDIYPEHGTIWNFADQCLQNPQLLKVVSKLPQDEVTDLANILITHSERAAEAWSREHG